MEDEDMDYKEQIGRYLEYCEFRKELDGNTLKAYRIDLKQFFEYAMEDIPGKEKIEDYITELHKKFISNEFYENSKEKALNYYLQFVDKDANNEAFVIPEYKF